MHPSEEHLIDHALGENAPAERRARIERHLTDGCARCAERLEEIRALVAAMNAGELSEPPSAWVERAVRLRTAPALVERVAEWLKGLAEETARLVFDSASAPGPALAGVRSGAVARRLRFESGDTELDLQVEPRGRGGVLTGQLVRLVGEAEPVTGAPVLAIAGRDHAECTTDELGEFRATLESVDGLEVHARVGDRAVRFRVLPVGATDPE